MKKFTGYLIAVLATIAIGALMLSVYLLKNAKPIIVADNYIESLENAIKKLKVKGDGNAVDVTQDVVIPVKAEEKKKSFFKRIFGKKKVIN